MKLFRLFAFFLITSSFAGDKEKILHDINNYRLRHLLLPLKLDEQLNQIALEHSQNMAQHTVPVGHTGFQERFSKIRAKIPGTRLAAENVAAGYNNVDLVISGWINSPGHRQNILGRYNLTGIAIAYDKHNTPYYTQVFAKNN